MRRLSSTEDRVDRGSQVLVSDLRRDHLYAAQGDFVLGPEVPFELRGWENVEAPTADVQRVDLCRILLGVIGEGIEVGVVRAGCSYVAATRRALRSPRPRPPQGTPLASDVIRAA